MSKLTSEQAYYRGVRASIEWLHRHADTMNDPHARRVLNSAAFSLGVDKPNPDASCAADGPESPGTTKNPSGTPQ